MDTIILEITDIKGNTKITGHEDKIQIMSFSNGVSMHMNRDVSNSERTMGRPDFQNITLSKMTDQATPGLYGACAGGKDLGVVKLLMGRNEGDAFMPLMTYTLKNTMVSNISTGGGGSEAMDTFCLDFTEIKVEYTKQGSDSKKQGTAAFGWDLATNKAVS